MRGTITRWGSRGYGFVRPDDVADVAWVHYRFLAEPDWWPTPGERVEFELKALPDGRYQAWHVRPAPQTLPPPAEAAGACGAESRPARQRAAPEAASAVLGTLGEALVRAGHARVGVGPAATSESTIEEPAAPARLQDRLTLQRAGAERAAAALRSEVDTVRRRIADLEAQAAQVSLRLEEREAQALREEADLIVSVVSGAADEFERVLADRRRLVDSLRPRRQLAVAQLGQEPVEEYEVIRRRLRTEGDCRDELEQRAYEALERERRHGLADLAAGLDELDALPTPNARFTLFVGGADAPMVVFVSPLRGRRSVPGGDVGGTTQDVRWRVGCVFWQAVERAACELAGDGAVPEYGTVAGSVAARLPSCDRELFGILLDEAWSSRPSLESADLDFELEVVAGFVPHFEPEAAEVVDTVSAVRPPELPDARTLPDAALRLNLSLRDLVVALQHHGLPFPDDTLDPGTEASLRLLVGGVEQLPLPGEREERTTEGLVPVPSSAARDVAARMLGKLLRDRRIGGRHTRIEHACGHHFADEEKALARRIAEFLQQDGILLSKLNEGAHHVSVNPRRLREVGEILSGTWPRAGELDRL